MEFDRRVTFGVFIALIVLGVGGLLASGVMATTTILMMVLPAVVVFGLICLRLGIQHGEHRATGK